MLFPQLIHRRIIFVGLFLFVYIISFLFWLSFFPFKPDDPPSTIRLFFIYLKHLFKPGKAIGLVKNGQFSKDYFIIKNKPPISSLIIDDYSVVIVKNKQNKRTILSSGFRQLERQSTIIHTLDLRPRSYTYGPNRNNKPFNIHEKRGFSLIDQNKINHNINRTKSQTAKGMELIPEFFITYRLPYPSNSRQSKRDLLSLSALLESKNQLGNISLALDEIIGSLMTRYFRSYIKNISNDEMQQLVTTRYLFSDFFQDVITSPSNLKDQINISVNPEDKYLVNLLIIKMELSRIWTP